MIVVVLGSDRGHVGFFSREKQPALNAICRKRADEPLNELSLVYFHEKRGAHDEAENGLSDGKWVKLRYL